MIHEQIIPTTYSMPRDTALRSSDHAHRRHYQQRQAQRAHHPPAPLPLSIAQTMAGGSEGNGGGFPPLMNMFSVQQNPASATAPNSAPGSPLASPSLSRHAEHHQNDNGAVLPPSPPAPPPPHPPSPRLRPRPRIGTEDEAHTIPTCGRAFTITAHLLRHMRPLPPQQAALLLRLNPRLHPARDGLALRALATTQVQVGMSVAYSMPPLSTRPPLGGPGSALVQQHSEGMGSSVECSLVLATCPNTSTTGNQSSLSAGNAPVLPVPPRITAQKNRLSTKANSRSRCRTRLPPTKMNRGHTEHAGYLFRTILYIEIEIAYNKDII